MFVLLICQDRSRSPVRTRSKSPPRRRDYQAPRGDRREDRRDDRRDRGDRSDRGDRGDRRGGFARRDRGSFRGERRRAPPQLESSTVAAPDDHRSKIERNYDNSIFVGNIPFETTAKDIEDMFGAGATIVRADIVTNRGRSRGMATVEFSNKAEVDNAISQFDRTELNGREIFVRQDYPPPEEKRRQERERSDRPERRERFNPNEPPKPGTEVFVGNLPFSVTWQTLKDLMRSAGDVVRADVMQTKWGKSRGFGTVVFNTAEEAAAAVEKFQGYNLEGRQIDIRPGRDVGEKPKRAAAPANKNSEFTEGVSGNGPESAIIFVGNLPYITSQSDLFELFETIGRVTRAEVQYNDKGRPSGNAVVEFELAELASLAIQNLDGYNYGGRDLQITFASVSDAIPVDAPVDVAGEAAQEIQNDPVVEAEPVAEPAAEVEVTAAAGEPVEADTEMN